MYLFHVLRSFLPLHNPLGWDAGDFIGFALALVLVALVLARPWLEPAARRLAERPAWCMLFLAGLVVVLRLALLPQHPVPTPSGADDFSYLLLGNTLAHFRLANPALPLHRFFETTFVLQQPTYSSIYQAGQGLVLAFGELVFHQPWVGVLLSMGLLSALCYWMLLGWTTPGWALTGGLIAAIEFGPLNRWMNYYWGGAVSAIAGCLVCGALPRLRLSPSVRNAVLLGAGIGLQTVTRPFESLFLDLAVVLFWVPELRARDWSKLLRVARPAVLALAPFLLLQLSQNKAVTGSFTTLPYALSRYQYGVPTTFTFQPVPQPHRELTPAQQLYYEGQSYVHGPVDTVGSYFERLGSRAGFYRFFYLAPLWLALPWFVPLLRQYRYAWIAATIALFALGTNFYPYFFTQYIAALTCLFVLAAVLALARMNPTAARWLVMLCGAHFAFWYFIQAQGDRQILYAMTPYETADSINIGDPEGRGAIQRKLDEAPGRQLVFVRYFSTHTYHEWIHNSADIDGQRVIWALDLAGSNDELKRRYPDRTVWLMEPDAIPPRLAPYPKTHGIFEDVQ
jgi:multisubunit Na+/H+ antiporter MnhB subunit